MLALPGMLSYPVWLQSIPILPLPLPLFLLFVGSTGAFSSRRWVGREGDSRPDPQEALLGRVPASWMAPHTHHTVDLLKILLLKRKAVVSALHNTAKNWNEMIIDGIWRKWANVVFHKEFPLVCGKSNLSIEGKVSKTFFYLFSCWFWQSDSLGQCSPHHHSCATAEHLLAWMYLARQTMM